jgi:hypothetical protein
MTQDKPVNKMLEYIVDLKELVSLKGNFKCPAKTIDEFRDEKFILDLLKWNALVRIAKNLQTFADPKNKDVSSWEKFNQKFQIDLIKMAQAHSYYMTGLYFYNGIQQLAKDVNCTNLVSHMKCLLRIFCLHSLTT